MSKLVIILLKKKNVRKLCFSQMNTIYGGVVASAGGKSATRAVSITPDG